MLRIAILFAAIGMIAVGALAYTSVAVYDTSTLSPPQKVVGNGTPFVDRLSALDKSRWAISDGWSNGDYMVNDWRKSQVVFHDGLRIALARNDRAARGFSSGEVQSRNVFGHGYYEATMEAASGSGVISGFFTYTGPPFGLPWNEIDFEILGKNTRKAQLTYFLRGESRAKTINLGFDAAEGLHHYAFDWQPGHIRWYIDGKLAHETTGSELPLPYLPQKIMFHLWGTDSKKAWAGPFDPRAVPTQMRIGCVAYSLTMPAVPKCDQGRQP